MIMTSKKLIASPFNPSLLTSSYTPDSIQKRLGERGCNGCDLGKQPRDENYHGPVIYRGNPQSHRMIIGEAPGKEEDRLQSPFVGPAGELLDNIIKSVGWSSEKDFYITNIIKCRPVGEPGSGKQNKTPLISHRQACSPYLTREIEYVDPYLIVLTGASAVKAILGEEIKEVGSSMGELAGRILHSKKFPKPVFFVMYHPAAILHAKPNPERYQELRKLTWEHIQLLKRIDEELQDEGSFNGK